MFYILNIEQASLIGSELLRTYQGGEHLPSFYEHDGVLSEFRDNQLRISQDGALACEAVSLAPSAWRSRQSSLTLVRRKQATRKDKAGGFHLAA